MPVKVILQLPVGRSVSLLVCLSLYRVATGVRDHVFSLGLWTTLPGMGK